MVGAKYETIELGTTDLDRIELPKFQREFVWKKSKQLELLMTLHKRFPFGALLVYPESSRPDSKLILLDGQQRLSTIKEYKDNPVKFWKELESDEYKADFEQFSDIVGTFMKISESDFDRLITDWHSGNILNVVTWADPIEPESKRKSVRELIKTTVQAVDDYIDLSSLKIWAIKFIGEKEDLPTVFANLNKGGVPLTKYQVLNAIWNDTLIPLSRDSSLQNSLLKYTIDYYRNKEEDSDFEVSGFSSDDLMNERTISLSELALALGAYVRDHLSSVCIKSDKTVSEIGFGLLGVAAGVDNRHLEKLINHVDLFKNHIQEIMENVELICSSLNDTFSKMLKHISADNSDDYKQGLTTTFKVLSYFAALWGHTPSEKYYQETLKNIKAYYVYDSLIQVWSSHGDQRLYDYYPINHKRNYLSPVKKEMMDEAFKQWLDNETSGINFSNTVKALTTIHANLTYLADVVPYGESFELEHIVARKLINEVDDGHNRKIIGSSLGNCMYLPRRMNNSKKTDTLYDINENHSLDRLIDKSLYPSPKTVEKLKTALQEKDYDEINKYIRDRANKVANSLSTILTTRQ